ncbi:formimidoylglutamase [Christiangramia sabulilitoris]|uniref:Formimidoylglutamase n=1 Tax=Christiangramia sabulilitoris TaxID=2583991 RepID=A0A550I7G3_9FLAO|nr:formimidoylglutamase [Christiangramia sabulilitoris]TRO66912.1 formimidoylglutamase [Christiangramia sabulilitoris]
MEGIRIYRKADIEKLIAKRKGETKFGEKLQFIEKAEELKHHPAKFVLLGIPEDIGVRANYGNAGTSAAWKAGLNALVNIQLNRFNDSENLIVLGELDCRELMQKASSIDSTDPNYHRKLGDLVKQIDILVADIIETIVSHGKIPVIIGGGHNNAYGNIKGASKALKNPVNILNIDAHTDLRQLEHRHSGNGFSYAIEGGFLNKYSVYGLHKNYTPEYIFKEMEISENLQYRLWEDLMMRPEDIIQDFRENLSNLDKHKFGFELDCDAIANFPSSAQSPTGFTLEQIRQFIKIVSANNNCVYFHICEAAPSGQKTFNVGKALAYFISDFTRAGS